MIKKSIWAVSLSGLVSSPCGLATYFPPGQTQKVAAEVMTYHLLAHIGDSCLRTNLLHLSYR